MRVKDIRLELYWALDEDDASCWKEPLTMVITPWDRKAEDSWETVIDLSREQGRLLRDCITSFLASPDLRQSGAERPSITGMEV
jgi:hypothetical protein